MKGMDALVLREILEQDLTIYYMLMDREKASYRVMLIVPTWVIWRMEVMLNGGNAEENHGSSGGSTSFGSTEISV